ncbi:GDSL-type esterase/lipase family protein [Fimbriimonas ginsengisoli]|uniref:1-alkyl-2-acetylglycerophosphocholine esterase n=1 Tax=Fimbriimonas ginsengisoli Gsoil 348 TaxID=661478 RepID=A0A068NUF3_FIMGI|nr:GDSL-type esterase/lipase family protein [Fimbriimonas ginsengisoli]AIE85249.1 1-alkyl-2-acetylglycerophosphocholine esterase [Fimbriimonas ginsengisoli Gsoil 348]
MKRILGLTIAVCAIGTATAQETRPASIIPSIDEAPMKAKSYDWNARHQAVLERVKKGKVELLLVGDSITHGWGGDPFDASSAGHNDLWDKYFAPRNTLNLGFGWDRTEHVLWRLQNGEIDGISPKLAVVLIGVNNLGRDSADDVATGTAEIVRTLRTKLPRMKILILGILPYEHEPTTWNRQKIAAINTKVSGLTTDPMISYLDLSPVFLSSDGTLSKELFPDYLHPNHRAREIWAEAMEPTLAKLFGGPRR